MPSWFKKAEQSNELTRKPITTFPLAVTITRKLIKNHLHILHSFMV